MDTTSLNEEIGYKDTRYIMNGGRIKIKDALQNVAEEVENFSRMPFFCLMKKAQNHSLLIRLQKKVDFSETHPFKKKVLQRLEEFTSSRSAILLQ